MVQRSSFPPLCQKLMAWHRRMIVRMPSPLVYYSDQMTIPHPLMYYSDQMLNCQMPTRPQLQPLQTQWRQKLFAQIPRTQRHLLHSLLLFHRILQLLVQQEQKQSNFRTHQNQKPQRMHCLSKLPFLKTREAGVWRYRYLGIWHHGVVELVGWLLTDLKELERLLCELGIIMFLLLEPNYRYQYTSR
ncbi:hypothetical protein BCR39DRAFT_106295 [Naematelia encephala]|uniref:Uncharacterized protein n=1 Tax=Naematelia encephala TaxID=71784 RepID=A0A1Y2B8I3_9TREE|nr:hypothetical protein BCR39DRAFT_106295 [Naematelia encephala]